MLTRRLVVIGTVAANAPYIGLLGTVLGIMLTFHTMGTSGALAVTSIMIGLSLALKATAAGLLVAIPCVVMNNVLRRRVSELLAQYKTQENRARSLSTSIQIDSRSSVAPVSIRQSVGHLMYGEDEIGSLTIAYGDVRNPRSTRDTTLHERFSGRPGLRSWTVCSTTQRFPNRGSEHMAYAFSAKEVAAFTNVCR